MSNTQFEIDYIIATSGNFTSLTVNGTGVSSTGHTHTSSNITDFNSAVRGLLPTIANSGDNRVLTSTGSTVGINAESNFTFDGSLLTAPSGNFTSSLQVNGTGVSISGHTHFASAISDSTTAGRALLTAADASAQRTSLGLGTLATQNGTFNGTSSGTNTGDQTISIGGDVTATGSTGALTATVTKINGVSLSGLSTGILKNTTGTGAPSIAVAGTDYAAASHTHTASNITDFNSSVSGLLPVTSIIAGSGVSVSSTSGAYTINAKVYSTTIGDGSAISYTITHNLSVSNDVQVTVRDTGTNYYVYPDIKYVTNNSVLIEFVSAPTSNQYRVSIIGF